MASPYKTHKLTAVVFFLFIFTTSSLSSARLLNDFHSHGLAATEPTLNLALPVDNDDVVDKPVALQEKGPKQQVLPCDHMVPIKNSRVGLRRSPRLAGKYGPMILNMLPRGPVPSSGPSKGTNNVKN